MAKQYNQDTVYYLYDCVNVPNLVDLTWGEVVALIAANPDDDNYKYWVKCEVVRVITTGE